MPIQHRAFVDEKFQSTTKESGELLENEWLERMLELNES